ncbi:MAG TPA: NAD(P)-binding domain-containing protein, partial [Anaerolineales bacterium]|nr:NAD(P)-binding domain-containing protein [Anaerolineales bacterium]
RQIGHTISWWPRATYFFSTTERIALAGVPIQNQSQWRTTGEEYLAYLRQLVEMFDLQINAYEPVTAIRRLEQGFELVTRPATGERRYKARRVVLAHGDMHGPNLLNIPGEDLPHVSHYFREPHDYFRQRLLIVGGRNSAVEAALRCWRAGAQVSISYRKAEFDSEHVKHFILPDLQAQIELGTIGFYPLTRPLEITPAAVMLERLDPTISASERFLQVPADFVFLATGFRPNMSLFENAGINLVGEQRMPQFNPETMETNVPGLYVAGTATSGVQKKYRVFIENSHEHVGRIVRALTGEWPQQLGTIPARQYELPPEQMQTN